MRGKVQAVIGEFRDSTGVPGVTACVVGGDGSVHEFATGIADLGTATPMTPSCRMLGGSTGKTLTAATALALKQRGILDLDAPIARWLSGRAWLPRLANSRVATVRNLLNHTSGIPDHREAPGFIDTLRQELPRNPDLYLSPDTLIRFVADAPPCGQIGRDCNYSETNYIVAGLVIEAAAGQRFHELVRELFLGPLALADTEPAIRRDLSRL